MAVNIEASGDRIQHKDPACVYAHIVNTYLMGVDIEASGNRIQHKDPQQSDNSDETRHNSAHQH